MRIGLVLCLMACSNGPTTLLVDLDGPASLTSLDLTVGIDGGATLTRNFTLGGALELPGTVLIELPDRAVGVNLDATGHGGGLIASAHQFVISQPHQQVRIGLSLGVVSDMGVTAADAAVDLAPDLAGVPPTPRLISTAWFSGTGNSAGMSHSGYSIATSGVADGDLLLLIANVDNGSASLWPNPMAPGFTQLVQTFFGSDGQTYVVDWKIASGEPATYTGTYQTGVGSSAAVMALIAVGNANAAMPINTFATGNAGTTASMPTTASSPGVTTTVPNCTILYAAGSDWLSSPGSNSFTLPAGYTSLMEGGDHGDNNWDWTSQMVGWKTQPAAGMSGTISGTLTSGINGIGWTVVIAVAPR
jgi:hypothetical protein